MITYIVYIGIQVIMLILWISGVMDRTLGNLIVALMPLWLQYGSLLIFKVIEKWLEKLVEKGKDADFCVPSSDAGPDLRRNGPDT